MRIAEAETPKTKATFSGDTRSGFFYALTAYLLWGFLPLYMKALHKIPAAEIIAHRVFWSLPVAAILLWWLGRTKDIIPTFKSPKRLGILAITASTISINWGLYVWAISVERTLETAMGYYINPLITVAIGAVFLGDRFSRAQMLALAIATFAVVLLTVKGGFFPWLSLVLAFSFAFYGFLRKTVDVGPTQGFLIEVMLLSPLALCYIVWLEVHGQGAIFHDGWTTAMLMGCGPVTAIPLILYAFGAKGLKLSTIGLMQYIAPTMIFLISIFIFREPFSFWQAVTFTMIWLALVIYSWSAYAGREKTSK